jgi:hypothetical protein
MIRERRLGMWGFEDGQRCGVIGVGFDGDVSQLTDSTFPSGLHV